MQKTYVPFECFISPVYIMWKTYLPFECFISPDFYLKLTGLSRYIDWIWMWVVTYPHRRIHMNIIKQVPSLPILCRSDSDCYSHLLITLLICTPPPHHLTLCLVIIVWKQWLLPIAAMKSLYCLHGGRSDPEMSADSAGVPGSALLLWHQYRNWAASGGSNHCFQAIGTCMNLPKKNREPYANNLT